MVTIREALQKIIKENSGRSVAAYLEGTPAERSDGTARLRYYVSLTPTPAAAFVYERAGKDPIYTNLAEGHWLLTYMNKRTVLLGGYAAPIAARPIKADTPQKDVKKVERKIALAAKKANSDRDLLQGSLDLVIADATPVAATLSFKGGYIPSDTGPIKGGGLAAMAKLVVGRNAPISTKGAVSHEAALEKMLRYYQLAAYGVIGQAKNAGIVFGHYVGAVMVNDFGAIVGWGINSNDGGADFHHAEVNMMLAYFQSAGTASLPANCTVFSSLTPCAQCAGLLHSAMGETNKVFFGQLDTGPMGNVGTAMSTSIDAVCKPVAIHPKEASKVNISTKLNGCIPANKSIASALRDSDTALNLLTKEGKPTDKAGPALVNTAAEFDRRLDKRQSNAKYKERLAGEAGNVEQMRIDVLSHIKEQLAKIKV